VLPGHVKDNQGIRPRHRGFMKVRSCLSNLISFYDQVTCLVDERKAVDVVYLDFSKAFDTVPHSTLLEKLAAHRMDGCTLRWVKNGQAQRVVVNGVKSSWQPVMSDVPNTQFYEFQQGQIPAAALRSQQPHATLQAWGQVAGKEKDLRVLVDSRLNMSQQCAQVVKRPTWLVSGIVWPAGVGRCSCPCTRHW